uniref:Uncharacterized protein n=1 Tax=Helicotheca tamesis TaxID=374047 RepID=A0A7S2HJ30_9STRA|mmetsp:Transcript_18551/g.25521  ORF Transcript_18551/g.25521 Transcript_18551/m.25521 type:complete len:138 (+) Transcript_18551:78-491(+)|eukprot:CAMPEP_0185728528 /NCGR_PEP_ID=MMETSP1171-20130828/3829_1 /TAXON_ID=374046 /ORGANISM="Helicotheca tamensis, Strain CCMP826" /LENGTH=137 /DNA_ID=CAMNT_0028397243 /DNA_START=60 /DNA_END=473 /DNA_ORIENTATION=-
MKSFLLSTVALLVCLASSTFAFAPPSPSQIGQRSAASVVAVPSTSSSTALNERQWNFNDGRGPWGMKKNAEIWNGRAAQMGFTVVLLQELITGKGVIQGLQDGDFVNVAFLAAAAGSVVLLTIWLAIQGKEDLSADM